MIDRLDERRIVDLNWYIGEYIERQTPDTLRAELRRHKNKIDPYFQVLLSISGKFQALKKDYRSRTEDWLREKSRADWLESKVQL